MGMTINKLIEFCEEEEYIHRIRCKQYDDASGFTRTGNKDIRTACAFSEEIKRNNYQQIIDIMRMYQKIKEILDSTSYIENGIVYSYTYDNDTRIKHIRRVIKDGNDKATVNE